MSSISDILNEFEAGVKALDKGTVYEEILDLIEEMKTKFETIEKDNERYKLQELLCRYGYNTKYDIECKVFDKAFSVNNVTTLSFSSVANIAEQIFQGKAVYEVIPKIRRLYLDIESAASSYDITSTIQNFIRYLTRTYNLGERGIHYIATRNDQSHHRGISSHVIFNIACDYELQRYIIRDFIMKYNCNIIDPLPYAKCQLLRVPYSMNPTKRYPEVPSVVDDGTRKPNEFNFISKLFERYEHPPIRSHDFHYIWISTYPSTYNNAIPYFCTELRDCLHINIDRFDYEDMLAETIYSADKHFDAKFTFNDDIEETPMVKPSIQSSMKTASTSVPIDVELSSSLSSMDIPEDLKSSKKFKNRFSGKLSRFERWYRMNIKQMSLSMEPSMDQRK